MVTTFTVNIVSQEASIYSGQARMLIASGEQGDLGIAPRHAPLLTTLRPGPVRILKTDENEELIYVSGGILEVQPTEVTILADTVLRGAQLDEAEAEKAKAAAEKLLLHGHPGEIDYSVARAELARAVGLLRAIRELKRTVR